MTLPDPLARPGGLNIFADNVYLGAAPTTLDEHAEDVRRVLVDDRAVTQLRRELIADLSDAEDFRVGLRNALQLGDQAAAEFSDSDLVASVGLRLQRGHLDWEAVNRVASVVSNFPADWSADDLARAVRSALHPLSSNESQVTAAMPAVEPAESGQLPASFYQLRRPVEADPDAATAALQGVATTDAFAVPPGDDEPRQPAMTQLPPSDHPDGLRS